MNAALAGVTALVLCGAWATPAQATCSGPSVSAFGAKGDGKTDDTAAIQSAINAAASAGGSSIVFNVARYYTTASLVVPASVILCGAIEGPFITLNGLRAGIADLLFHYSNQVGVSASAPNVYPYTIVAKSPGTKVVRSTVTNAYNFLDIESGI